jgi:VanZ family protein
MPRVIVPVWLAILVGISLVPDPVKYELGTKGSFHAAWHLIVFGLTGVLFCWNSGSVRMRIVGAFAGCSLAVLLEALETFVYRNRYEWKDVCVDCLGVAIGLMIVMLWPRYSEP